MSTSFPATTLSKSNSGSNSMTPPATTTGSNSTSSNSATTLPVAPSPLPPGQKQQQQQEQNQQQQQQEQQQRATSANPQNASRIAPPPRNTAEEIIRRVSSNIDVVRSGETTRILARQREAEAERLQRRQERAARRHNLRKSPSRSRTSSSLGKDSSGGLVSVIPKDGDRQAIMRAIMQQRQQQQRSTTRSHSSSSGTIPAVAGSRLQGGSNSNSGTFSPSPVRESNSPKLLAFKSPENTVITTTTDDDDDDDGSGAASETPSKSDSKGSFGSSVNLNSAVSVDLHPMSASQHSLGGAASHLSVALPTPNGSAMEAHFNSVVDEALQQSNIAADAQSRSRYRRLQLLGRGAHGETWLVEWLPPPEQEEEQKRQALEAHRARQRAFAQTRAEERAARKRAAANSSGSGSAANSSGDDESPGGSSHNSGGGGRRTVSPIRPIAQRTATSTAAAAAASSDKNLSASRDLLSISQASNNSSSKDNSTANPPSCASSGPHRQQQQQQQSAHGSSSATTLPSTSLRFLAVPPAPVSSLSCTKPYVKLADGRHISRDRLFVMKEDFETAKVRQDRERLLEREQRRAEEKARRAAAALAMQEQKQQQQQQQQQTDAKQEKKLLRTPAKSSNSESPLDKKTANSSADTSWSDLRSKAATSSRDASSDDDDDDEAVLLGNRSSSGDNNNSPVTTSSSSASSPAAGRKKPGRRYLTDVAAATALRRPPPLSKLSGVSDETMILSNCAHPCLVGFVDDFIDMGVEEDHQKKLQEKQEQKLKRQQQQQQQQQQTLAAKALGASESSGSASGSSATEKRTPTSATTTNIRKPKARCLVMEYVDNGDLRAEILRRRGQGTYFGEASALFLFAQICSGVEYLHRHNVLHRDLKTANILISKRWSCKICDAGFAVQSQYDVDGKLDLTPCGSPYYLSPEIFLRHPYGEKSDVWSLGVILYEMLSSRRPFESQNVDQLAQDIVYTHHRPLNRPSVSEGVVRLIEKMLAKNPDDRPSVKQVLQTQVMRPSLTEFVAKFERAAQASNNALDATWADVLREHVQLILEDDSSSPKSLKKHRAKRRLAVRAETAHDERNVRRIQEHVEMMATLNGAMSRSGGGGSRASSTASGSPRSNASLDLVPPGALNSAAVAAAAARSPSGGRGLRQQQLRQQQQQQQQPRPPQQQSFSPVLFGGLRSNATFDNNNAGAGAATTTTTPPPPPQ